MTGLSSQGSAPVVLEGDYSDWTIYDSFDDANASNGTARQYAVVNKAETEILLIHLWNISARKYTISTKTLGAIVSDYLHPGWYAPGTEGALPWASAQRTYFLGMVRTGVGIADGITVWKNGDIIKTFTSADLGLNTDAVRSVSISPSGNYIIVSGQRTATGNMGWVVLVGS